MRILFAAAVALLALLLTRPSSALDNPRTVDDVLGPYVQQLGGLEAIDKVQTREVDARRHHGPKIVYYWQKPNKVLEESKGARTGYNGSGGWTLSRKRQVNRLPKGAQDAILIDANPIRYAHLKDLYFDVQVAPAESIDDTKMDVLIAPNNNGATKFFFDANTHLLARIEETGVTSAYFKQTTEFMEYKEVDGVKFPFRIVHKTTEPGIDPVDIRISNVETNVDLDPQMFDRPSLGVVVRGGKR